MTGFADVDLRIKNKRSVNVITSDGVVLHAIFFTCAIRSLQIANEF
ncbi:hypothetical protein HNR39_002047 [Glaciimonas immobilis]|uniref:Uncharacterized protein n=1 Tax=Glaciimonas immobilis TaxID=728004 RepID=A0A840RSS7_9BURK|nr:hypothetical protein [Glaciimonas immobilis]